MRNARRAFLNGNAPHLPASCVEDSEYLCNLHKVSMTIKCRRHTAVVVGATWPPRVVAHMVLLHVGCRWQRLLKRYSRVVWV